MRTRNERDSALAIAFVALTGLGNGLGMLAAVGAQRAADVVALVESTFRIAPHIALVRSGVDQLALTGAFALAGAFARGRAFCTWHCGLLSLGDGIAIVMPPTVMLSLLLCAFSLSSSSEAISRFSCRILSP